MDGIRFRRKLRIRHYESAQTLTAETPVFVEIKQRVNRVAQKRRVVLPYREALRLCDERRAPPCLPGTPASTPQAQAPASTWFIAQRSTWLAATPLLGGQAGAAGSASAED